MSVTERDILHTTLRELFAKNKRLRELEATLQAKDAQIEALADLMQEARNHILRQAPKCECYDSGNGYSVCIQCKLRTAIKEATP